MDTIKINAINANIHIFFKLVQMVIIVFHLAMSIVVYLIDLLYMVVKLLTTLLHFNHAKQQIILQQIQLKLVF